jgi:hypothetical protein
MCPRWDLPSISSFHLYILIYTAGILFSGSRSEFATILFRLNCQKEKLKNLNSRNWWDKVANSSLASLWRRYQTSRASLPLCVAKRNLNSKGFFVQQGSPSLIIRSITAVANFRVLRRATMSHPSYDDNNRSDMPQTNSSLHIHGLVLFV